MTTTKIKGLCKGSFKRISHLFAKERDMEMEIGSPTDVKHVAHIGWNGPDSTAPTWMNDFKEGSNVASTSVGSIGGSSDPPWSSQDFENTLGRPKKQKRKTKSSTSTPKTSSARSSRSSKPKSMLCDTVEGNTRHNLML